MTRSPSITTSGIGGNCIRRSRWRRGRRGTASGRQVQFTSFWRIGSYSDIDVPKGRDVRDTEIPITYVPARNTIFLSFALAWAETLQSSDIFIGVNALDYSGYPDCLPEYIEAYERMANLATKAGVEGTQRLKIRTPLIAMTKARDYCRMGSSARVESYSLTSSCYAPVPSRQAMCRM